MPSRSDTTGFGVGPAALPTEIIEDAAQALMNYRAPVQYLCMAVGWPLWAYNFVGAWVARKHREIGSSVPELKSAVKKLKMDYIITGSWSRLDSEFAGFPKFLEPGLNGPIAMADMSSNILSRTITMNKFSAIFFGTQKNLETTGITVVVINKSFLPPMTYQPPATLMRQLGLAIPPRIFEYETFVTNNSLYNTLNIFDVYIAGQVLKRLLLQHPKVQGQQTVAEEKAQLIYRTLEAHPDISVPKTWLLN
ncbi:phosphoserine aminotransferase [Ilyonectria destructans]|nr:phosphoserine aminotransferase [Ilyonectria destructans]